MSSVQTFPSSQFGGVPPLQVPPRHASDSVQALPSSQLVPLATGSLWQVASPPLEVQPSVVQALPSSQSAVTQGSSRPAKLRSVQSHFEPAPAWARVVQAV